MVDIVLRVPNQQADKIALQLGNLFQCVISSEKGWYDLKLDDSALVKLQNLLTEKTE